MSRDDASDFKLRAGRIRDRGARVARGERMYVPFVAKALQAAAKANGGPLTAAQWRGEGRASGRSGRPRKGRCCRVGRGQVRAEGLKRWKAGQRASGLRLRRAVVKARIVRIRSGSKAADAHVRYLQRDGVTRDGQRGQLYGPDTDSADGHAFVERGREDRHQFRFIVAPEDGEEVRDLREFTRDLMTKMEEDLGTRLDWVAVDHFNTGHPHSHVLIRGKDHLDKDLVIAQDYITDGLRIRAEERLTQELGLVTDLEYRQKLERAIEAERFTGLDRQLIEMAPDTHMVDVRLGAGAAQADQDLTLVVGRLKVLERYNLAWEEQPGVWSFSRELRTRLETLADRNDILNAMHRALAKGGRERAPGDYVIGGDLSPKPVVGQVIGKRLTDELGEKVALIVDGVDGKTYHVPLGPKAMAEEAPLGSIVQVGRPSPGSRAADRNIMAMRDGYGIYQPSMHKAAAIENGVRVPGNDYDGYITAHVRRLEALRRAGIVERHGEDHWSIPPDFEKQAEAYDLKRSQSMNLKVLSAYDLDRQITSDGATWLDQELTSQNPTPLGGGLGRDVSRALDRREEELVRQGMGRHGTEGQFIYPKTLLSRLQEREVNRVGREMAAERGLRWEPAKEGEYVSGTLIGKTTLASGRFAMLDNGLGFALVPWQDVLDQQLGRHISGVALPGMGVDWSFGRGRGLGL